MKDNYWENVNADNCCRICGKPDWCSRNEKEGLEICQREKKDGGESKKDKNGEKYFLYGAKKNNNLTLPEEKCSEVYNDLLNLLDLDADDEKSLIDRGFTHEQIQERGYKSLPSTGRREIVNELLERHGKEQLELVPGVFESKKYSFPYLTLAGYEGILVPCRNDTGLVSCLKIRASGKVVENKYSYFSSKKHGGPGARKSIHVPIRSVIKSYQDNCIRFTEGELKSDLATELSDIHTLSVPGVNSYKLAINYLNTHPEI
jgi:hypothetical protein